MTRETIIASLQDIIEHAEVIKSHAEAETPQYHKHVDAGEIIRINGELEDIRCNIADEMKPAISPLGE